MTEPKRAEDLSEDDHRRLHRAPHEAAASLAGAWKASRSPSRCGAVVPAPSPAEALDGARGEFERAYDEVIRLTDELLDWNGAPAPAVGEPT